MDFEELASEFLEDFFRLGRYHRSREISSSMKGEAFLLMYLWQQTGHCDTGGTGKSNGRLSSARVAAALNKSGTQGDAILFEKAEEKDRRKIRVELTGKGEEQAETVAENVALHGDQA